MHELRVWPTPWERLVARLESDLSLRRSIPARSDKDPEGRSPSETGPRAQPDFFKRLASSSSSSVSTLRRADVDPVLKGTCCIPQDTLDVKETMTSTAGVPSDDHQPQLYTPVKPEDALQMLILSELRASLSPSSPPMQPSRSLSCETGRSPELHRAGVDPPDEEFSWAKKDMISRSLSSDACDTGTSPKWHDPQSPQNLHVLVI